MDNTLNSYKNIPIDNAKNLIIAALNQYHPELADKAANILERKGHTIIDNPERVTGMMRCRPAGYKRITDENDPMYISEKDFETRYKPNFTDEDNELEYAVIDFEYTGTPDSIIHFAHEIGHAIAYDIQKEKGLSRKDFTYDQQEEQAYFVQSIVSHYTGIPSSEDIVEDNSLKAMFEGSSRPEQFRIANNRLKDSLPLNTTQRHNQMIIALSANFDYEQASINHLQKIQTNTSNHPPSSTRR